MNLAEKLKALRIQNGFSQEELANRSGIALRTIQRIEKGNNEPRGNTLQMLCSALNTEISVLTACEIPRDNSVLKLLYITVLIGIVVPLGNVLGPVIVWSMNKGKSPAINSVAKHVIWTQVAFSVVSIGLMMYWIFEVLSRGAKYDLIPIGVLVLTLLNYGIAFYAMLRLDKKEKLYYYVSWIK